MPQTRQTEKTNHKARTAARIWAVQALYQMELTQAPLEAIITEFATHRLHQPPVDTDLPLADIDLPPADADYFAAILRGVITAQEQIDTHIAACLREDWRLSRLDSTLRALLRAGAYEILYQTEQSPNLAVSEYTDMAHAFFATAEAGMVNALLDRLSKEKQGKEKQK